MNFYIKELKLWFKTHTQPQSYYFKKNKVNVITGDSSTGKSSILQIIDYCLLSSDTSIVEDVINHNVSWYGLAFNLNGRDFVIARKAPSETGIVDKDFYWAEDTDEMPYENPVPSIDVTRASLLTKLNKEFQCQELSVRKENNGEVLNLSFRSFLILNYLTEEIIATNHTYLDSKFFGDENIESWEMEIFKLAIGMEEIKEEDLQEKLQKCNETIKQQLKAKKNDDIQNNKYKESFDSILKKAKELHLFEEENTNLQKEEIAEKIKIAINEFNRFIYSKRNAAKIEDLMQNKKMLDKKIRNYNLLRNQYNRAKKYVEKSKDSLSPVQFIIQHLDDIVMSEETMELINSLEHAYNSTRSVDIPQDFLPEQMESDLKLLEQERAKIEEELKSLGTLIDRAYNTSWLTEMLQLQNKLSKLKINVHKYKGDEFLTNQNDCKERIEKELNNLKSKNQEYKDKLLHSIQAYYDIQNGMSDNYRNMNVQLHDEKVILRLVKNGNYYAIKNVGSKSNFMFMHLCFFLGLHEHLLEVEHKYVPNFLFIDQPSIPYYGANERKNNNGQSTISKREDRSRLKSAFKLINSFMKQNVSENKSKDFQIILIEHADPSFWTDCDYFETRYVFTEDKDYGLIPKYVYEP